MHSYVLTTCSFPERHTGIEIASKLQQIVDDFKIASKVSVVVHDQAANMLCTLHTLESEQGRMSLNCTAHCLQLCLKPGLDLAAISGHFKHSVVATEALKKRPLQMIIDEDTKFKKLTKDCTTRWNSSFFMIERLVELRWPISAVLSDETITKRSDSYLDLKTDQWEIAEQLIKVFKPFDIATTFSAMKRTPQYLAFCPFFMVYCIVSVLQLMIYHLFVNL